MPRKTRGKELVVWANGMRVGHWRIPSRSAMEFEYVEEWMASNEMRPLSLSLPLTFDRIPQKGRVVEAYFDNLLPDSESVRKRVQERFRTASRQPFDLLAAIGRDCVGAVQLLPPDQAPAGVKTIRAGPLTDSAVARAISAAMSSSAVNVDRDEFRISIAGVQEKTAFLRHNGRWCRPIGSTPTTHIFKLPLGFVGNMRADMSTSVENEWLCSRILAAYGMPIASCDIELFGKYKVLVVERFDRLLHSSTKYWLRLMQEDMCQATGTPNHGKYEADGGPGLLELAHILQGSIHRDQDLTTLFKAQLFFWMLAATDGHAKNFSIRILEGGRYQLTPLYDVLSAWPIIGKRSHQLAFEKVKLAMAMHATRPHYRVRDIQRRHFDLLARQIGLGSNADAIIGEVLAATPGVIETVQRRLPRAFPQHVLDAVLKGLADSAKRLE